jgi:hypothetical protein
MQGEKDIRQKQPVSRRIAFEDLQSLQAVQHSFPAPLPVICPGFPIASAECPGIARSDSR